MKIAFKDNKILTLGGKTFSLVAGGGPTIYTVTCEDDGHGSILASPTSGVKNTVITLSNTPDAQYRLNKYTLDGSDLQGDSFRIRSNCIAKGWFERYIFNISVSQTQNGSVTASAQTATSGTTITLSNTPSSGYELDYYTVNGVAIVGNTFTMPSDDVTVGASFKEESLPFNTVTIGNQIWTDYLTFDDGGTGIYTETNPSYWRTIPGTFYYYNGSARTRILNKFSSGGWRIPTVNDWNTLYSYAGSNIKKLMSNYGWGSSTSYDGTDDYGFCLLPLGYYSTSSSKATYVNQYSFLFCTTSQSIRVNYNGTVDTTNWIGNNTPAVIRLVKDA